MISGVDSVVPDVDATFERLGVSVTATGVLGSSSIAAVTATAVAAETITADASRGTGQDCLHSGHLFSNPPWSARFERRALRRG